MTPASFCFALQKGIAARGIEVADLRLEGSAAAYCVNSGSSSPLDQYVRQLAYIIKLAIVIFGFWSYTAAERSGRGVPSEGRA